MDKFTTQQLIDASKELFFSVREGAEKAFELTISELQLRMEDEDFVRLCDEM